MQTLWHAIVDRTRRRQVPRAFFPRSAYRQTKAVSDPDADYRDRLVANYAADVEAAHRVVAGGRRERASCG